MYTTETTCTRSSLYDSLSLYYDLDDIYIVVEV